jgi:hypothetical protein
VPVFVRMKDSKEIAVVTDGVRAQESGGTLQVFDSKGTLVGKFQNVQEWYVGQARPNE